MFQKVKFQIYKWNEFLMNEEMHDHAKTRKGLNYVTSKKHSIIGAKNLRIMGFDIIIA